MIVEAVLLGDLVGSLRSAGYVNGKLIRIDRHWSRPRSRFRSRTSQQRAHNQQRHPEDHVVDCEWRRRILRLSGTVYSGTEEAHDVAIDDASRIKRYVLCTTEFSRNLTIERNRVWLFASRFQCSTELASLNIGSALHFLRENTVQNDNKNEGQRCWRMKSCRSENETALRREFCSLSSSSSSSSTRDVRSGWAGFTLQHKDKENRRL